jgi:hypothetical protein
MDVVIVKLFGDSDAPSPHEFFSMQIDDSQSSSRLTRSSSSSSTSRSRSVSLKEDNFVTEAQESAPSKASMNGLNRVPSFKLGKSNEVSKSLSPTNAAFMPAQFPLVSNDKDSIQSVPESYICPIGFEIMRDPVICADGITYDRKNISQWLAANSVSPKTNQPLSHKNLTANIKLQLEISQYLQLSKIQRAREVDMNSTDDAKESEHQEFSL